MEMKRNALILTMFALLALSIMPKWANAQNFEGTGAAKDYVIILVHGINGTRGHFDGTDHRDPGMNLKKHLEDLPGLNGRVFAYSFSDKRGSNWNNARELGDRSFKNPSYGGESWLKKAQDDFINNPVNKGKLVPSRYIFITHSMGNYAARMYIYSKDFYGKYFWEETGNSRPDVDKVVFIAPPFEGSDMAWVGLLPKPLMGQIGAVMLQKENLDLMRDMMYGLPFWVDLSSAYRVLKAFSTNALNTPLLVEKAASMFANEKDDFDYKDAGIWELLPTDNSNDIANGIKRFLDPVVTGVPIIEPVTGKLETARLPDPQMEPDYSVVYGKGNPVFSFKNTAMTLWANKLFQEALSEKNLSGITPNDLVSRQVAGLFPDVLNAATPEFQGLSTSQAKFMSTIMSSNFTSFVDDGDAAVSVTSAKGQSTRHLKNAKFHTVQYKVDPFEHYLNYNLPTEAGAAAVAYYGMLYFQVPPHFAQMLAQWTVVGHFMVEVAKNADALRYQFTEAHTNMLLKEYDTITTALLDSPAIFKLDSLQTNDTATTEAAGGVKPKSFSNASTPASGYSLLTVSDVTQKKDATTTQNAPVPVILDGETYYASEIKVTKPPKRVQAKINYLIPKMLKSVEYSFNGEAWKSIPISSINEQTGEFFLDDLPFSEGNNTLAIKTINFANVSAHQHLSISLNQTPAFVEVLSPKEGTFTNNNKPVIKTQIKTVRHDPAEVHGSSTVYLDGVDVTALAKVIPASDENTLKTYVELTPENPLTPGEHHVKVLFPTNVGPAQALWSFTVDTESPTIQITPFSSYSPRAPDGAIRPFVIKYILKDNASPLLKNLKIELVDSHGNVIATLYRTDSIATGEQIATWKPEPGQVPPDGKYRVRVTALDAAGNALVEIPPDSPKVSEVSPDDQRLASIPSDIQDELHTTEVSIDSSAPQIFSAQSSPTSINSKSEKLEIRVTTSEPSQVIANLKNKRTGEERALFGNSEPVTGNSGEEKAIATLTLPLAATATVRVE